MKVDKSPRHDQVCPRTLLEAREEIEWVLAEIHAVLFDGGEWKKTGA